MIYVGFRALVIDYSGTVTPFYDEWDGDAAGILVPYVNGKLTLGDLLTPFSEHIIFFNRLLTLITFNVSGYWDVILKMIVNSALDAATVVGVSYALSRVVRGGLAVAAMILSALMSAVPLSSDTILMGFTTHFTVLLTFAFASLWFFADSRAWSVRWAAGFACAAASYLDMASGALTFAAASGLHFTQAACGRRAGVREWLGLTALAVVFVILVILVPRVPETEIYRAHSVREFLSALWRLASWPAPAVLGWLVFLPSALFCLRAFADRPELSDARWFNLAALGWIWAQFFALAAGRGGAPIANRYFDTLLIGAAINLTSAFWLFESCAVDRKRKFLRRIALGGWLAVLVTSLAHPSRHLPADYSYRRQVAKTQTENLQSYLATARPSYLEGAPGVAIPYPDSGRLRQLLDTPEIRAMLPPQLLLREAPSNGVEAFKRNFLGLRFFWLGSGILLLVAGVVGSRKALAVQGRPGSGPSCR